VTEHERKLGFNSVIDARIDKWHMQGCPICGNLDKLDKTFTCGFSAGPFGRLSNCKRRKCFCGIGTLMTYGCICRQGILSTQLCEKFGGKLYYKLWKANLTTIESLTEITYSTLLRSNFTSEEIEIVQKVLEKDYLSLSEKDNHSLSDDYD
jgi:hypothetical protein